MRDVSKRFRVCLSIRAASYCVLGVCAGKGEGVEYIIGNFDIKVVVGHGDAGLSGYITRVITSINVSTLIFKENVH